MIEMGILKSRKKFSEQDHETVNQRLDEQSSRLKEMAKRLMILEIEAGIYKPPLRGVSDDSRRT